MENLLLDVSGIRIGRRLSCDALQFLPDSKSICWDRTAPEKYTSGGTGGCCAL